MIQVLYAGYGYSIESYDPDNEDLCIFGKVKQYVGKFLISLNGFAEISYFSSATVSFLLDDDSIIIICDESGNRKPIELFATGEMSTSHGNKIKIDINDLKSETTPPTVQQDDAPKEKTSKYQERNNDFMAWLESETPPLEKMTKKQIHTRLIERNSQLWTSGFKDWWEQQNIYKASRGRKSTINR